MNVWCIAGFGLPWRWFKLAKYSQRCARMNMDQPNSAAMTLIDEFGRMAAGEAFARALRRSLADDLIGENRWLGVAGEVMDIQDGPRTRPSNQGVWG
jgi:hypothetical protein